MSEKLTDAQIAENELICEKLLGWIKAYRAAGSSCAVWQRIVNEKRVEDWYTPSFTAWAEAGLILEALSALTPQIGWQLANAEPQKGVRGYQFQINGYTFCAIRATGPEAIRDCTLLYLKAMKS